MAYTKIGLVVNIALFCLFLFPANAADIPHAINYQGKLYDSGGPANGAYDFQVALYDASTGGTELWVKTFDDVNVNYGLFSLVLDNSDGGTNISQILTQNADLWIEVRVRPGSSTGSYTVLGSREELLASPWAITIADDAINEDKIDWGTGSGQVSADDVPFSADDAGWGASPPTDVDAGLEDLVNRVSTLESGSGNYVQLSPASAQNDADATSSIWINKTAASGNLMELEVGSTDQFVVNHTGSVTMAGSLTVGGNDISGGSSGQLYIRSNGSVRVDLDDDGGGSESFKVANGSDNIVFEVTEGGNVSAEGNATFDGNLTLSGGSSERRINGPTDASLSVISETNLNLYIDGDDATGSVNSSAFRVYRDQPGGETEVFEVTEGGNVTVHGDISITDGTNTGTLTTSLTGNHTWTLPDATGTIALTSDIVDNYADGVGFNDGTNTLTISRTGTLSDLTTTIPVENDDLSDNQLTELSDVNTTGAVAGSVLKYDGSQWVADTDNEGISGSGSAGQVAYFTGASTVGGMNSLFWDSSNERLGLGTNNPMYRLDVRYTGEKVMRLGSETGNDLTFDIAAGAGLANIVAGATWDAADSRYEYTGTRGASRIMLHDGSITLYVGGTSGTAGNPVTFTTGLNINSSGNVGIKGNASSGDALYVYGSGHFTGNLTIGNYTLPTSDGSSGQVLMTDGAGNVSWSSAPGDNWGSQVVQHDGTLTGDGTSANPLSVVNIPAGDNDYIQNQNSSAQSADFWISGTGHLGSNLYVDGNVGIGTLSPSAKLEVRGDLIVSKNMPAGDGTQGLLSIRLQGLDASDGDDWHWQIYTADPDGGFGVGPRNFEIWEYPTGDLSGGGCCRRRFVIESTYGTSNSPLNLYLAGNGNVGVGTTSPSYKLDVQGTGRFTGTLTVGAYTLPSTDGSTGQVLTTDGSGSVNWQDVPGDNWGSQVVQTSARLTGDGTSSSPLDIAQMGASSGDVLKWDGSEWAPGSDNVNDADHDATNELQTLSLSGNQLTISGGNTVTFSGWDTNSGDDITTSTSAGGDLSGTYPNPTVVGLQGRAVSSAAPSDGQVLTWNNTAGQWEPQDPSGGVNGSGTPNHIPKWTATNTLGTSVIYEDGTNVGIGTTSLSNYRLKIKETSSNSGYGLQIENADASKSVQIWVGTGGAVIDAEGTTNLHLRTAGSDRVFISNGGNVGIATTDPKVKLHITGGTDVVGTTANTGYVIIGNASGQHIAVDDNEIQSKSSGTSVGPLYVQTDGGDFILHNNASAATRFIVQSDGDVGIGTTSPSQKLHIAGNGLVTGNMYFGDTDAYIYQDGSNNMMFRDPNTNGGSPVSLTDLLGGASMWQDGGAYIYPSTATSFHIEDDGDLDLGGHNIERANEISANNIDPVLKIGGKLYRTWTLDMVGQRTEVVGQAKLNSDGVWTVDLATQPEASDLWLFWHAVDQKTIIPFVTPQGPVQMYAYLEGSKFFVKSIDGTGNVRFSYRLIGVRYDFRDMTPEETNIRTKPTDTYIDIDAGQRYGE